MKRKRTRQASVRRCKWQTVFGKRWLAVVLSAVLIAGNVPAYALDALAYQETSAEGVTVSAEEAEAQDDTEAGASGVEHEASFGELSSVPQEVVTEDPSAGTQNATAQETAQEAAQEQGQEAAQEQAQEQGQETAQEQVQETAQEEAQETAQEQAQEQAQEEATELKEVAQEADREDQRAADSGSADHPAGTEEDPIEEPAEEGGLSDLNEAAGFRVDELEDLSAYLAFGEEKELAAGGHGMFFFKFVPEENGFYALRTSDLMNAGVYGYIYDWNANLAAEMHPRTGQNIDYTYFLRGGRTYYFEIILNRVGSATGELSARFRIENSTSGYYFAGVGEHDRTAVVNTEITLEVEAYSTSAITYMWFFNNSVIQGATSASYTFVVKKSGRYHCRVQDADGHRSEISYVVYADNELSIRAEGEEEYTEQTDVYLEPGDGTQLKVVVSAIDMSMITYEWSSYVKKNTAWGENWEKEPISGENGSTLVLEAPGAGSRYVCTVSDQYGNSAEKFFYIYIDNNLTAYAEGTEQTSLNINTAAKQQLRLGVTASADEDSGLTYTWYRGDTVIEGAQTDSYKTMLPQSAVYKCVVSDPYGNSAAVSFNVHVDNELAAYAGGMQSSKEDIYVTAGEPALMTVDVTAIDKSDLTYVWEKELRTSIPWGYRYEWRQISGAETQEYTAEAVSEDTNYRCTVSDQYGSSAQVSFAVHVAEEEQFIEVRLIDPSGGAAAEGYTVKWYAEDGTLAGSGAKLHGVTAQQTYMCDVRLGEDLSFRYEQPEPAVFTAGENSESHDLQLNAIEAVTITGTVSSKAGEKIPGASVKLKQVYNGQYTKLLETEADDSGCFTLPGFKTESTLIVSAADYFDGYYAVAPGPEETEISVSAVLEEIPANRITLSLFMRKAAVAGEEGEKQELAAANGLSFSVRNMTRMSDLSDYKVQFPYIVLGSEEAGAGDVIRIFAEDAKGVMAPGEIEVTLDEAGCAEAEWILVQNGSIRVRKISGNDENTVIVFGEDGKSVQSGTAAQSFDSGPLPEGNYSCVLIKKTGSLMSIDTLDRLAEFGLSEGRDYIKRGVAVEKGIIAVIDGAAVPALDEKEFIYTVADGTQFWANRTEAVAGQYVRMSLAYEIDDRYESADETVTFELPEGMTFIERSLTVDGKAFSCTVTEHSGMQTAAVPVGRRTGTIRFNVMLTATGSRSIYARLSFQNGTSALSQPLGSLLLSISGASISVPEKTGQKTVTVTGQTLPDCKVTVYDNGTEAGTTTTNKNGAWALKFDLVDPYHYSRHMITGKIESAEFGEFETEAADLYYNSNFAQVSRVVMRNQSFVVVRSGGRTLLSQPDPVVFDFLNPSTAIPSFTYSPGAPMFTFVVEFTKNNYDPDAIRDVYVITTDSSGARTKISCSLDERTGRWIGTHSYGYSDVPCKLSVSCVNNTGATYDTDYSEDEMSAILEEERNICAEIGEQVADKVQIGNEQEQPGKVSFDAILGGKSIGNCAIEEMDFSEIDLDRWLADHRVLTDTADGKTCYTAYEFTDSGFDIYVVIPEDRMMGRMTFTPAEEFRSEMENAANEALSGLIEEANAALAEADAAAAGELSGAVDAADGTSNAAAGTAIANQTGGFTAITNFLDSWAGIVVPEIVSRPILIGRDYDALFKRFIDIKRSSSCPCGDVSGENNRLFNEASDAMSDYLQIALVKFGFSMIIDTVLRPFIVTLDTGYWTLNKLLHYLSRNAAGKVVSDLLNYKGSFNDALGKINAIESGLKMCYMCGYEQGDFCNCRQGGDDEERQCFLMTPRIDPSGYVYEAVPSNRVSGVKAEVYSYDYALDEYGFPEENKSEILWDAENYDQVNPQYTDGAGAFGWDVPEGQWLVKFSKEGYEDTDSRLDAAADEKGYLPVPPIQTEVNTAIVSKAAPSVSSAAAYPGEVRIGFSQYMQIGSVNTGSVKVTAGGKQAAGTIRPLDAEYNYEKTEQFASSFAFVPDKELSGTVTIAVSGAKNYCGKAMEESYRKAHTVEAMPKEILITGSRNIAHYGSTELTVKILPAEAGRNKTLTVTTYAPDIVSPETVQSVTADQNGVAKVVLNGNLPGQGILSISLDGTEILENILITVGQTSDTVSLEDGGYSISLDKETLVYSGKAQTPKVTIDGLTEGTDFTVGYENNVDPGTATVTVTGIGGYTGTLTGAFTILPGKTKRGDMFNLANNVKVTWYEVPGAKYYKVYREGVTDPRETRKEPVIVTTGLVGWDKDPGLTNGNAYRYRIVASLSGRGDSSGDSTLSYSKLMYRLKTVVIRSVKNTAPGKVTVKYDRTVSGDSYVLQYCEREDMVGAKTKVVLGAANTSYVIGGLKKGKTYYISIRVRKKVGGIDYYTTFGVAKKIKITK